MRISVYIRFLDFLWDYWEDEQRFRELIYQALEAYIARKKQKRI